MKYKAQEKSSGKWLADYNWDGEDWVTAWTEDRAKAKLLSGLDIRALEKDGELDGCKFYRIKA